MYTYTAMYMYSSSIKLRTVVACILNPNGDLRRFIIIQLAHGQIEKDLPTC
jgi:hypothetical protein